ncbi:MAG: hypothetical protein JXB62_23380, partial [Pirellulales bacterium]|nr:hypothetical protein [Pirellulales bacterium]
PDENVWLLKWDEGGKPLLTAWTVDGTAPLGLDLGRCRITDAFGARIEAESTGELEITPFPIYVRDMQNSAAWRGLLEAYDVQQREIEQRRQRAKACRKYLYDFGPADRVGEHLLEGIKFGYTPVGAADVWDEARGYGFNLPAMSDENRAWVRSKLDGDGCRMRKDLEFRFRVEPGTYSLSVGFSAHAEEALVRVEGLKEPLAMPLSKKEERVVADEVVVGKPTILSISHDGYGEIRWVNLIEKSGSAR